MIFSFSINQFDINAQKNEGGIPESFIQNRTKKLKDIPNISMSPFNISSYVKEDSINYNSNKVTPFRFAKGFPVEYSLTNSGVWDTLVSGDRIWRLKFKSPHAFSLIIYFTEYDIPDRAKVFVYNKDTTQIMGAFTSNNNNEYKKLAIAPVQGDEIIVEYLEPKNVIFKGHLTIGNIGHDYIGINDKNSKKQDGRYGISLTCETNIACVAPNWQDEKGAIGRITLLSGVSWYYCTGALINNTRQDGTPYFLTANHCVCSQDIASTVIVTFNYESQTCLGGDGSVSQTISGSTLLSHWAGSDFSLLQLSSTPAAYCNPYFLGWDRSGNSPTVPAVCIHHPQGDVKKISIKNGLLSTSSVNYYQSTDFCDQNVNKDTWLVSNWDMSTTEGGSSGAPLLNNNHRVVGQLYGGNGVCNGSSTFGKFSASWSGNNTPATQLSYWLDPISTGVTILDGTFRNSILGPALLFCTQTSYKVNNAPPNPTISWDCSSNISKVSAPGVNPFYFQANGYGTGWIQASVNTSCGITILPQVNVWVGKFEGTTVTGQTGVCPNSIYTYTAQVPGGHSSGYSYSWTYPSNWMKNNQYQNSVTLQTPLNNPAYGTVRVSITNPCGTSGYSGITVYPGGGCPHYFTIYPNPASDNITITMIDNSLSNTDTTFVNQNIPNASIPTNFTVKIYNSQSALISSVKRNGLNFSVPLTNMRDGTYIVEVSDGKTSTTQTLIVKHN